MQLNNRYDFQRKDWIIPTNFPVMKGFTPLKVRNQRVFSQIAIAKKPKHQKTEIQKEIKFIERMKKARQLILSHHRKNKFSQSLNLSRKSKTEINEQLLSKSPNKAQPYYYRIGQPAQSSEQHRNSIKNLSQDVDEQLRACQSDFNARRFSKKSYLYHKVSTHQISFNLDEDGKNSPNKNPQQVDSQRQNFNSESKLSVQNKSLKIDMNCLQVKNQKKLVLPSIRNYDESFTCSIKRHKRSKINKKDYYKFNKNTKLTLKKQIDIQGEEQVQQPRNSEQKIFSQKISENISQKPGSIEKVAEKRSKIMKKKEDDLNFEIEGWKLESIVEMPFQ